MNMKKIIISLLSAIVAISSLSSCDSKASEQKFENIQTSYDDVMTVSLYCPDFEVENDPLCKDSMLCSDYTYTTVDIKTEAYFMSLGVNGLDSLCFSMPFLVPGTDEVRPIFKNGVFAKLYERLKAAVAADPTLQPDFDKFKAEIAEIHDTLSLKDITTNYFPVVELGAALFSWDAEQNSNYVKFQAQNPVKFSRKSNIFTAMYAIQTLLSKWYKEEKFTAEELSGLNAIKEQQSGETKAWGWGTFKYANYRLAFDLHVEPEYTRYANASADGMLDKLAIALFGKNAQGKPNRQLWLILRFDGDPVNDGTFEIVK